MALGFAFRAARAALLASALAALLAACGGGAAPVTYDLTAPREALRRGPARGTLVVAEPVALQSYDSDRIIVRAASGNLSVLAGAQWADRLPRLVQARMIQTIENSSRYASVGRPGDRLTAAYNLVSEIRAFEIQEASGEAVVEITLKLVADRTGQIGAGRLFSARVPAGAIDGPGASAALDQSLQNVLRQIAAWI